MPSSKDSNHRQQQDLTFGVSNGTTINSQNSNTHISGTNNNNTNTNSNLVANNLLINNINSTEQPQTKRQKIEKIKASNGSNKIKLTPPPDIIDTGELKDSSSSLSSSVHSVNSPISSENSTSSTPCSSRAPSLTQLINVQNMNHIMPITNGNHCYHQLHNQNEDDLMSSSTTKTCSSSSSHSADEVDRSSLPDLLPLNNQSSVMSASTSSLNKSRQSIHINATTSHLDEVTACQDMRDFEESLNKQCLCGVSERMLRKPFQSHYYLDANGQKRVANLNEWPTNKLLQFLSNLQLLFDIYLKQNSKGLICARIMDVCDALICNDHNLIDEIIVLAGYSNAYVQFLAGRVLAAFLVIAKQEMDDNWLKKLVDNLFNFDRLDHKAVQKIHFSLEIIKRIIEWRDIDLHPLEEVNDTQILNEGMPSTSSAFHNANNVASNVDDMNIGYLHFQAQQPSLETNYFAVHYRSTESLDGPSSSGSSSALFNASVLSHHHFNSVTNPASQQQQQQQHFTPQHHPHIQQDDCHLIAVTDSESFDTTHLKCKTIKILENKWPALVENMTLLIKKHLDVENAENCILNFLQLWEKIISVKANLPIGETQPFYAQLDIELLLNPNLSCTVYKQMLCLFNEALCYGSTLALQDMLPNETCKLAHQIFKDSRILESLPRRQPENIVGLIGFKGKPIHYASNSLQHQFGLTTDDDTENNLNSNEIIIEMDKTIMQKIVLLVLKSIAVTVKIIRSDSSDSSIDSADNDAYQEMQLIQGSIRDVLCYLESFIKRILNFFPQCDFSSILIRLFDDQDDHLIEAMVCTLDVAAGISFCNNPLPELVSMLNPVETFSEFLNSICNSPDLLLDLLVSNETCFLLYLLRFLKYIRINWAMFVGMEQASLVRTMNVLKDLRLKISRLVSIQRYPYDISPVLRLLESCERFYEGEPI